MNKAVIYARFSSAKQNEQSIEGQLRHCEQYAEAMGYKVVGSYIDRALSGTNDNRPQFQQMIDDSNKHLFDYIIVWKLDRFARNRYDSAIYKTKLKKNGVKVVSATEGIGDGDESIILEAVLESMAEIYSKQLAQNVKRGMNETALKASSNGGVIPLGYRSEDKKLVIDEKEAEIVRFIFNSYADGMSKTKIAQALNERNARTTSGQKFTVNSFSSMLSNEKYIGIYHWNGVEKEGGCPAIIDKELFDRCQQVAKLKKRTPGAAKAKVEYLLQGKLFCGHCGSPMVGDSGKGKAGTIYHYYACGTRKRKLGHCDKKREKKDFIEWYVVEQTVNFILTADRIDYIADKVIAAYRNSFSYTELKRIERRIKQINKEFDTLADSLLQASSARLMQAINKKSEALEQELQELEEVKYSLSVGSKVELKKSDIVEWLNKFVHGDPLDFEFKRKIINSLVNAVYLFDDKLVIYFNVEGGKQVSYIEMLEDVEGECSDVKCNGSPKQETTTARLWFFVFRGDSKPVRVRSVKKTIR